MAQKSPDPLGLSQHKVFGEVIFKKLQFREKKHLIFETFWRLSKFVGFIVVIGEIIMTCNLNTFHINKYFFFHHHL